MEWELGRQNSGYDKMKLFESSRFKFDMWLLRFREGSSIPPHTDKNEGGDHYRINIILKAAKEGGEFVCSQTMLNLSRLKFFRPDLYEHSVTQVVSGTRYVLSVGWLK